MTTSLRQAWWCTPGISALRRLRQEDLEFEASWDYIVRKLNLKEEVRLGREG
jgi:hypothetical protein